jgi:hypothetical protein
VPEPPDPLELKLHQNFYLEPESEPHQNDVAPPHWFSYVIYHVPVCTFFDDFFNMKIGLNKSPDCLDFLKTLKLSEIRAKKPKYGQRTKNIYSVRN